MMTLRRFLLSAWLSYRALFIWLNPWGYVSTRILAPILVTLLFSAVGRLTPTGATRPVIGGSLFAIGLACVYGLTLAVANERDFGTLEILAATPEGQMATLLGKALPHALDGILSGCLTLAVVGTVFGVSIPVSFIGPLLLSMLAVALSCSALGMFAAAVAVSTRDTFTTPNLFELLLTLLSGAFIAPERLPLGAEALSAALPLRHGIEAALQTLDGAGISWDMLGMEVAVGAAWGVAGYAFLHWMMARARRHATLSLM